MFFLFVVPGIILDHFSYGNQFIDIENSKLYENLQNKFLIKKYIFIQTSISRLKKPEKNMGKHEKT